MARSPENSQGSRTEKRVFDADEVRTTANETLRSLREAIANAENDPEANKALARRAANSRDWISHRLKDYAAADTPEKKSEIESVIRKRLVELQGMNSDEVYKDVQDRYLKKEKEKGEIPEKTTIDEIETGINAALEEQQRDNEMNQGNSRDAEPTPSPLDEPKTDRAPRTQTFLPDQPQVTERDDARTLERQMLDERMARVRAARLKDKNVGDDHLLRQGSDIHYYGDSNAERRAELHEKLRALHDRWGRGVRPDAFEPHEPPPVGPPQPQAANGEYADRRVLETELADLYANDAKSGKKVDLENPDEMRRSYDERRLLEVELPRADELQSVWMDMDRSPAPALATPDEIAELMALRDRLKDMKLSPEQRSQIAEKLALAERHLPRPTSEADVVEPMPSGGHMMVKLENNAVLREASKNLETEEKKHEIAYFEALRTSQQARGFWNATKERLGGGVGKDHDPDGTLANLKRAWVKSRADRARLMLDSIDARRAGRGGEARQSRDVERVRARYQRLVVMREAAFGAEEREQKVRKEGLGLRDKNVVDRVWKAWNSLPAKRKILISGPLMAAAGTAAMAGGAWPVAILALGGAGAARINWIAENRREKANVLRARDDEEGAKKEEEVAKGLNKFAKLWTLGGWGSALFGGGTHILDAKERTQAEETLTKRRYADLRDEAAFIAMSEGRSTAAQKKDVLANREQTVGTIGAYATGIVGGHALGSMFPHAPPGVHHGTEASTGHPLHAAPVRGNPEGAHTAHGTHGSGTQGTESHAAPPVMHKEVHAFINTRGEGADHLFRAFKQNIQSEYGTDPAHYPLVVKQLFDYKSMDAFSSKLGFENFPKSAVMHGNPSDLSNPLHSDTFSLSPDGKVFTYLDAKGMHHTLMQEVKGTVVFPKHPEFPMRDTVHHAPHIAARPEAVHAAPAARVQHAPVPAREAAPRVESEQPAPATRPAPTESAPVLPKYTPLGDIIDNRAEST